MLHSCSTGGHVYKIKDALLGPTVHLFSCRDVKARNKCRLFSI